MHEKYARQIIMPEIGTDGQKKLKNSKVLVIGAGGLGCPALMYLNGAGVGTLGIVDSDTVNVSNLHRQILHTPGREGMNKAVSAQGTLHTLNPDTQISIYPYEITPSNAEEIIKEYDFIIDAVDNFETKFLINDCCVINQKPFCHAGVIRFNGQAMTYVPKAGPCIRCIFEDVPEAGSAPTCLQAGILGTICGIIGCIQATEAIKYLTGSGDLLTGSIFTLDALTMKSRISRFPNPSEKCRVCGKNADIDNIKLNGAAYIR